MKIYCNCGNQIKTTWWKEFSFFISESLAKAISGFIVGIGLAIFSMLFLGYMIQAIANKYPNQTFEFFRTGVCNYNPEQLLTNLEKTK